MSSALPYEIVCFDVDGTLVDETVFVWETVHNFLGADTVARRRARDDFRAGRISYQEWADHDIKLWRECGATRELIIDALSELRLMPGARETLRTLGAAGIGLAILSGSIDLLLDLVLPEWPDLFDHVFLNRLRFAPDGSIQSVQATPYDMAGKARGLMEIARRCGCSTAECVFVGDNDNDVDVSRVAGLSIAFNCKSPALARTSTVVVPGPDLRAILPHILGPERGTDSMSP